MTNSEISQIFQIVRDFHSRVDGQAGCNRKDWHAFKGCQLLHTAVAIDLLDFVDYETFVIHWLDIIALPVKDYMEFFNGLQKALLDAVRLGLGSSTLVDHLLSAPEFGEFSFWINALVHSSRDEKSLFKDIYQLIAFPLRLSLSTAEADYDEFLRVNSLRPRFVPDDDLIAIARRVIDNRFCDNVLRTYRCSHGPGAVSFPNDKGLLKTSWFNQRLKDDLLDRTDVNLAIKLFSNESNSRQGFLDLFQRTPVKVIDVPKTWKKRRLIAVESTTAMYLQQGLKEGLYKAIRKDSCLSRFIDLERPDLNGELAREGSISREYGTIDLSSASDSVGFEFVRTLFEDTPLWKYLKVHRSDEFRVPGGSVRAEIFATMGNAICFPIETIVFTLLVIQAQNATRCWGPARVYGDDIVAPYEVCKFLFDSFDIYGFMPNIDKSFFEKECPFRESCGYEWYDGASVTPVRISRKFAGLPTRRNYEQITALIDLANQAHSSGFKTLYAFITNYISSLGLQFPFTSDGRIGFKSDKPWSEINDGLRSYYDPQICRTRTVADQISIKLKRSRREPELALREWLAQAERRIGEIKDPLVTSTTSSVVGTTYRKKHYVLDW